MRNLHLIYNKLSYSRLGEEDFVPSLVEYNWLVTEATFDHQRDFVPPVPGAATFTLRVEYPGLLIGAAGTRGVGRAVLMKWMSPQMRRYRHAQDFSSMITLDHTTGQPYIPGSTVKGTLRRFFTRYPQAVAELLGWEPRQIPALRREMFDGEDVFFDAVLFDSDPRGQILKREYMARRTAARPHQGISALKVAPGVRLQFRFMPKDGLLTARQKLWLYRELLLIGGIGSRTRAGYGALSPADETPEEKAAVQDQSHRIRCPVCAAVNYPQTEDGQPRLVCYRCKNPLR